MACPVCGDKTAKDFRPFCSRRCADVDLGRWMTGAYTIPVRADDDEDGETPDFAPEPPKDPRAH